MYQYIHARFGSLSGLYVRLYDSNWNTVGDGTYFDSNTKYISRPVTNGELYYIQVKPAYTNGSGNYKILFNTSSTPPAYVITFTIDPIDTQTYTGALIEPSVTVRYGAALLTPGTDYSVVYENNINVGTATVSLSGAGNYEGSTGSVNFIINPLVVTLAVDPIDAQNYTGGALTPPVTVQYGGTLLSPGTDYSVSYESNTSVGTATVRVSGAGNYEGSSGTTTFTIAPTLSEDRFEYYWVDEYDVLVTSGNALTINRGQSLSISAQGTGYVVREWHLNGAVVPGQNGTGYTFSSAAAGRYVIGLFVEKDGRPYNTNITVTVR